MIRLSQSRYSVSFSQWLQILDELNIGAFMVDCRRRVSSINYSAQSLIGLRESEAVGRPCREVFMGVPCLATCMFKDNSDMADDENEIRIRDEFDEKHLFTRVATPVYDACRHIVGCLTIIQDQKPIADLIDRIRHEERNVKIILDNLDIGVFTVSLDYYLTFFNKKAEKISGYDRREVLGKPCATIFKGEASEDFCALAETVRNGITRSRRGKMITRHGETVPIHVSYMALRNEKETIVGGLATFHDLTLVYQLDQAISDRYTFNDMIGKSPAMQRTFERVHAVASTDATVLIEGQTGTGKDLLAKAIHSDSRRADRQMVKVNCAAIPESLLESEMFGYVRGAFTGADQDKPGRFQEADGGTLFLDEIGDLPLPLQAKLLRVLEEKVFYPLGSRRIMKADVRIITATNRNLRELVGKQLFREDLYYRLNVFRIELPALKDRRLDIPLLIRHIIRRLCAARNDRVIDLSGHAMEILLNYDYPGNIRELENILEHALIVCRDNLIQQNDFPEYLQNPIERRGNTPAGFSPAEETDEQERVNILRVLRENSWNRRKTAASIGIDRSTLWRKMKKLGLKFQR